MKQITYILNFLTRIIFRNPKGLISLEKIGIEPCIHLCFGERIPDVGGFRAVINDSLLLSGKKIVRIGSQASQDIFWVVSGLEDVPISAEEQWYWLNEIIRSAPDKRVAIHFDSTRSGRKLKQYIQFKSLN